VFRSRRVVRAIEESISWRPREDAQGGLIPTDLKRAQRADLITLPLDVSGTNCGNCRFIHHGKTQDHCAHPAVAQPVNERMCCAFWDNDGVRRSWGTDRA
jgi:hypothetical protein